MTGSSGANSLAEMESLAKEKLEKESPVYWAFINIATGDRQTFNESFTAFKRYYIVPQVFHLHIFFSDFALFHGRHLVFDSTGNTRM